DQFVRRPAPLYELLAVEAAWYDDAVYFVPVKSEQPVDQRLDEYDATDGQRILDAAVENDVVEAPALAFLAHHTMPQHLVGRAGELEGVGRHHHRNVRLLQSGKDRRREMMIDIVGVGEHRRRGRNQLCKILLRLDGIDDLGRVDDLGQHARLVAVLDFRNEVFRPFGGFVSVMPHGKRYDIPADLRE